MIGLAQIKTWALGGLAILSAVLFGWMKAKDAKHANARRKGVEKAREVERDAHEELTDGLQREQQEVADAKKKSRTGKRDHFS